MMISVPHLLVSILFNFSVQCCMVISYMLDENDNVSTILPWYADENNRNVRHVEYPLAG